jgi:hypothetical protein
MPKTTGDRLTEDTFNRGRVPTFAGAMSNHHTNPRSAAVPLPLAGRDILLSDPDLAT